VTNVHSLKDGEQRTITESLEQKQEADAIDQLNLALRGLVSAQQLRRKVFGVQPASLLRYERFAQWCGSFEVARKYGHLSANDPRVLRKAGDLRLFATRLGD
jgi:hypothetical protein